MTITAKDLNEQLKQTATTGFGKNDQGEVVYVRISKGDQEVYLTREQAKTLAVQLQSRLVPNGLLAK